MTAASELPSRASLPACAQRGSLRRALIAWYRKHRRELPWRGTRDPYRVWVSEIILQQTRVDQGTPYIERFLDRFPTVDKLATASVDEVVKLWEGLGYYSRARNLHRAAQEVAGERGRILPETAEEWRRLPGVGKYTAGAIASIAYDEPAPILDGNVKRVLSRLCDVEQSIDTSAVTKWMWETAEHLVQGKAPGDFNQGLMELGAEVCVPKGPQCEQCPVAKYCLAHARGTESLRPVRTEKAAVPHREIVIAAIRKNGRYLLGNRPPNGLLGGLWEFPGGKVERGESHEDALLREVREELGIEVQVGGLVASVRHAYSHFKVTLNVYACQQLSGTVHPRSHTELKWVTPARFAEFAFPKANHKFLHLLE